MIIREPNRSNPPQPATKCFLSNFTLLPAVHRNSGVLGFPGRSEHGGSRSTTRPGDGQIVPNPPTTLSRFTMDQFCFCAAGGVARGLVDIAADWETWPELVTS